MWSQDTETIIAQIRKHVHLEVQSSRNTLLECPELVSAIMANAHITSVSVIAKELSSQLKLFKKLQADKQGDFLAAELLQRAGDTNDLAVETVAIAFFCGQLL